MVADKTDLKRVVVFRTADSDTIYKELKAGCLRQGWGGPGLDLQDVDRKTWAKKYQDWHKEEPSPRRYSALRQMLAIEEGDVVVLPKQPAAGQFSIARVTGRYEFDEKGAVAHNDFGHVIPVAQDSVRTFDFRANGDAHAVSGLFSHRNRRYPVTFAYDPKHIQAAFSLLEKPDCLARQEGMLEAALDDAIKVAAKAMLQEIRRETWSGQRFQSAVKHAFESQGYNVVKKYRAYDGEGADADIVVSPPNNNYSLFMPQEIAVQVKWRKNGEDPNDIQAVEQLVRWQESNTVKKFVISSADSFTKACKERADAEDITLIGGLDTMYFLMGIDRIEESG